MRKSDIRRLLRQRRTALSAIEQTIAAQALNVQLQQLPLFRQPQSIGLYYPNDGEISPLNFVSQNPQHRYFLPSLSTTEQRLLYFHPWKPKDELQYNHLGVAEPKQQQITLDALSLSVILMPLVGFDSAGTRLGMGGGFYDYTLRQHNEQARKPYLIGLAHACQQHTKLTADPWDIPLDAVITDKDVFIFQPR